jgi:hypothetical protein
MVNIVARQRFDLNLEAKEKPNLQKKIIWQNAITFWVLFWRRQIQLAIDQQLLEITTIKNPSITC